MALSSSVRIRIFDIGANRGVGNERCVIYDAKNVGSEVYANDVGSAFWTLPINHPLVPELVPLKRHYKVERLSSGNWILIGAGLLTTYDATNDEIVYEGMDYMTMLSMHYTKLVGPESGSEIAIKREEPASTTETVTTTLTATRSASTLFSTTSDWNSNDTEQHMVIGAFPNSFNVENYYITSNVASVFISGTTFSLLNSGDVVYISGTSSSRINGLRTISNRFPAAGSTTSGQITFSTSSGSNVGSAGSPISSTGYCYFKRYTSRGLVKFTLPSTLDSTATVTTANLILTQSNTSGDHSVTDSSPGDLLVNASGVDWTTDSTTGSEGSWGNANDTTHPNCDWGSASSSTSGGLSNITYTGIGSTHNSTHTFSISSIVNYWKSNPSANNNGILMYNTNESGVTDSFTIYSTAASASYRPKLALTYTYPTSAATNINANGLSHGPAATKAFLKERTSNSTARHAGNEIAVYTRNEAGEANKIDMVYDEVDSVYTLTGYTYIERSAINNDEKLYNNEEDVYIPNRFNVNRIRVSIVASPGDEVCTFNVWPDSWTEIAQPESPVMLKWRLKLRQHDANVAEVIAPASTVPTLSIPSGQTIYGNYTGTTHNITNSYEINCLTSGVSYTFAAYTMAELVNVSPQTSSTNPNYGGVMTHDVNGISASTSASQTVVMGLEKKTLQGIFDKQIPYVTGQGESFSRFGWLTFELASGQSWNSELIRYFTSGESVLSYLRSMCDKEMAANLLTADASARWDVVDGIKIPWRTVFNFVGVRGSAAPGTKLYVAPAVTQANPVFVFDYPGMVDQFRYRRNGKDLRNSVRVVPATAFLTGSTTSSGGSRSQGKLAENESSIEEYGYAPVLTTQANFADAAELEKYAQSQVTKSSDILNVSMVSIQLAPDSVKPFEDFFLGDIVRVAVRRQNVNYTNASSPDFIADTYIVGGVRFELPVDGSERVTLDLVKTSEFGRG